MTAAQPLPLRPPHLGPVVDERTQRARYAPHELAIVLSHFNIGTIRQIHACPLGSRQAPKVRLVTDRGQFLLKRRAPGRDDPRRVAFAHDLQHRLHREQYPVPALVPTLDKGESMLVLEGRIYELFEFVEGERGGRTKSETVRAGAALGRLHRILNGHAGSYRPPSGTYHAAAEIDSWFARLVGAVAGAEPETDPRQLTTTVDALRDAYAASAGRVEDLDYERWKRSILHGDWHPGNLIYREGEIAGVLDFDSARLEPRIIDVANGALQFSMLMGRAEDPLNWPEGLDPQRIRAFMQGYDSSAQEPLNRNEQSAMPWLIIEALVVESIVPIAATGAFGRVRGSDFLHMVHRKVRWLGGRVDSLVRYLRGET